MLKIHKRMSIMRDIWWWNDWLLFQIKNVDNTIHKNALLSVGRLPKTNCIVFTLVPMVWRAGEFVCVLLGYFGVARMGLTTRTENVCAITSRPTQRSTQSYIQYNTYRRYSGQSVSLTTHLRPMSMLRTHGTSHSLRLGAY